VHSSISSSEVRTAAADATAPASAARVYLAWSIWALVSLAIFCAAVEGVTRFGFSHISRIEARVSREHKAAVAIRKRDKPVVLLVGNSLMLEGIDYPRLSDALAGHAYAVRFPIEQTQYLDWYYGLRRLFHEGAQPTMVVLCMSAEHLIDPGIRGDYSSYYLFRLRDIPQIGRDVNYDLTKTSSLVLARFSLFYAGRSSLRNFILGRADPAYAAVMKRLAITPGHFPPEQEIERIAELRLKELRTLCASHGASFAYLIAPGFGPGEAQLVAAAARSKTDLMVPVHLNEFGRDKFLDGFHLNATGAQIYTAKVSELLNSRLSQH
jgi:hypothetical protein